VQQQHNIVMSSKVVGWEHTSQDAVLSGQCHICTITWLFLSQVLTKLNLPEPLGQTQAMCLDLGTYSSAVSVRVWIQSTAGTQQTLHNLFVRKVGHMSMQNGINTVRT
jgi:hypothetical protein